jgi:hypothetical protein
MARIINILSRLGGRRGAKLALVALLVGMVTLQLLVLSQRGYSSDDVAQQTILSQWQRGYAQTAWVGDDNWYLKFPLYWVANQLDVTPYTRAMVTSWILTTTTMVGVLLVLWRVVELVRPPNRAAHLIGLLLPAVALLALAPTALYFISTNNTRNIEIPILLLLLYWLLRYDRDNRRPRRYVGLAIVGMAGLLLADDPIFKFMGLAALLAVLVWRWLGYRETTPRVLYVGALAVGAMLVSLLVAKAVEVILPLEYLVHPAQFTTIDGFYENARTMVSQNLELFGAHFWGLPRSLDALFAIINLSLLAAGLLAAAHLMRQSWQQRDRSIGLHLVGLLPFWIIMAVLVANFHAETRYLILLPFILILALVLALSRNLGGQRLAVAIVLAFASVALFNAWTAARALAGPAVTANAEERAIADIARDKQVQKGFAPYWRANIATYMSNNTVDVIGVNCDGGVEFNPVLAEHGVLQKPANKSFVLSYPAGIRGDECSVAVIEGQFGRADETVDIPAKEGGKMLIYHRDITSELGRR